MYCHTVRGCQSATVSASDDFGGIARESVSLPPLTADRPRNPNRRPPSRYLNEMAVVSVVTSGRYFGVHGISFSFQAQQAAMPPPVTTAVSPRLGQKVLPVPVPPKKPPKSPVAGVKKSGKYHSLVFFITHGGVGVYLGRHLEADTTYD